MAVGQRKRMSDETRAAVIAALLEGQAISKIAADYKIHKSTVSRINSGLSNEDKQQIATKKEIDIASHIARMLDASFEAISNVLAVTRDAKWLNNQSAAELATFVGVTSDKVFRVLEAIENANTNKDAE